jgi:hypothetical protein
MCNVDGTNRTFYLGARPHAPGRTKGGNPRFYQLFIGGSGTHWYFLTGCRSTRLGKLESWRYAAGGFDVDYRPSSIALAR